MVPCGTNEILHIGQKLFGILLVTVVDQENAGTVQMQPFCVAHITIHDVVIVVSPEFQIHSAIGLRVIETPNCAVINLLAHT